MNEEKKTQETETEKPKVHADVFTCPSGVGKEVRLKSGSKVALFEGANRDALFEFTRYDGMKTFVMVSVEALFGMVYLSERLLREFTEKNGELEIGIPVKDLPKEGEAPSL